MNYRISISPLLLFFCLFFINFFSEAQVKNKVPIIHPSFFKSNELQFKRLLRHKLPQWENVLDSASNYRLQIYLAQIDEKENGNLKISYYQYPSKVDYYTYPASIIKLPMAVLFLLKLDEINLQQFSKPISLNDRLFIDDSTYCGQLGTNGIQNGMRIGSILQELLQKSNNTAFNPLYDVVRDYKGNQELDFMEAILQQRFSSKCDTFTNQIFAAYHIEDLAGNIKYAEASAPKQPSRRLSKDFAKAGKAYLDNKDSLITSQKSFERSNYVSIENAHQLLVRFVTSEKVGDFFSRTFRDSLFYYMSELPSKDTTNEIYPNSFKYLYYGSDVSDRKKLLTAVQSSKQEAFHLYNKVGQAYGFLSDVAYFESEDHLTKYVLAASIFVDRDGVLNDGKYAYDEIGFPFMADLGKLIFQSEFKRTHQKRYLRKK